MKITVTRPLMPPLEEFIPYLERIWENRQLTNCGEMHGALEKALCEYLGVNYIALFANGTLALMTALQSLRITGEVITTPYSFVATANSLLWNGIKPVFVDIDPVNFNLDPRRIEAAITPQTTAIMPVHCYGAPCDITAIDQIAHKYNLKVIYDAAHAFAVEDGFGSILRYGDLSVLSFHATKVFNTFEGGAIICPDEITYNRISNLKNFGFVNETQVIAPGINGKMNEVSAGFGLLQLRHIDQALARRREIDRLYREQLCDVPGLCLPPAREVPKHANCSYFPVLIELDFPISRDQLYSYMYSQGVHARRYFYPLISEFPMYKDLPSAALSNLPVANMIAKKILCLPIYPSLQDEEVKYICSLIRKVGCQ